MIYRIMLKIEADEPGVLRARELVKQLLEPLYGPVNTITVEEWFWQAHEVTPAPFRDPIPEAAHHQRIRGAHRRFV